MDKGWHSRGMDFRAAKGKGGNKIVRRTLEFITVSAERKITRQESGLDPLACLIGSPVDARIPWTFRNHSAP